MPIKSAEKVQAVQAKKFAFRTANKEEKKMFNWNVAVNSSET